MFRWTPVLALVHISNHHCRFFAPRYAPHPLFAPPFSFSKSVTFDGNSADSGAAFALLEGSLTFENPDVVRYRNGEATGDPLAVRATDRSSRKSKQHWPQITVAGAGVITLVDALEAQ